MTRTALGWIGAAGLALSIVALAILFLATIDRAAAHFARGTIAQEQLADALAIRDAARAGDGARLSAALAVYRARIAAETQLVARDDRVGQARELADARALERWADVGAGALDRVTDRIVARERREAAASAQAMRALRGRAGVLALLLALAALISAALGVVGLLAANRRLTRAVAARTAEIAAVDASRRLFFAKVSHELRTPVTVMRGEAEVALATGEDGAGALRAIVAQSELLDRRVAELLALSQAEDGRLALARDALDLGAVARAAAATATRHAVANAVTLDVTVKDAASIAGDARWLEQAMVAALDNAIKFSPEHGHVELVVAREARQARVSIADRGDGVAIEALPRLFDAFYQTVEGRARGGNGLGLALARWVVEQHGGAARAVHRPGGGCEIRFDLPVTA